MFELICIIIAIGYIIHKNNEDKWREDFKSLHQQQDDY